MKKLLSIAALFLFLSIFSAQTKYWLSGLYSDGNLSYLNNGKPATISLYWENGDSNDGKNVVVYGNFEVDEKGIPYFNVTSSAQQVNLYIGNVAKQKFACNVNSQEGKLKINDAGKTIDFVSFLPLQTNSRITVTKADWGLKTCNNVRYSVYYIQGLKGNSSSTPQTPTTPEAPSNTNNSSTGISSVGSLVSTSDAEAALAFHNKSRADVGVAPLIWSSTLADFAQKWANHLVENGKCDLQHRPNSGDWKTDYGENIAMLTDKNSALESSKLWYNEISKFKNVTLDNTNWYDSGHYSQMVWRNTKSVGIGVAKCTNGYYIVVGNYDPPGNYMGQKAY